MRLAKEVGFASANRASHNYVKLKNKCKEPVMLRPT